MCIRRNIIKFSYLIIGICSAFMRYYSSFTGDKCKINLRNQLFLIHKLSSILRGKKLYGRCNIYYYILQNSNPLNPIFKFLQIWKKQNMVRASIIQRVKPRRKTSARIRPLILYQRSRLLTASVSLLSNSISLVSIIHVSLRNSSTILLILGPCGLHST